MPASPAVPGTAWPGEVRARRRSPRFGSRLRALHICVGRLRYRRACGAPVRACSAAAAGPGARGGTETRLNYYSSPVCVHPVHPPSHACPHPARACIVLPRAAPQSMRPREPREPDTAEDAGGQTDHLGQAYKGGLRRKRFPRKPPSFMNSLNPLFFSNFKVLLWTESSILAQDERWRRA